MTAFALTLTTAGLQALVNAQATGTNALTLVSMGYTSTPFAPTAALTAVPAETARLNTVAGQNVSPATIHVSVQDASAAEYNVYGFGFYLSNGTLLGTYSQADIIVGKAAGSILLLACDLQIAEGLASAVAFGGTNFLEPPSSEAVVGVTRYATSAETIAGQINTAAVHPLGLAAALSAFLQGLNLGSAANQPSAAFDPAGAAAAVLASSLQKAQNLADLMSAATARVNLGLGSAATQAVTAFDPAGAAAGVLASSLQKAQNLADVASAATARANLGLGSAATQPTTAFDTAGSAAAVQGLSLQKAQNLADLAYPPTARANLGLGPLAAVGGASALAAVVSALGYTPVRQGGGANQGVNVIQLGWDSINATHLRLQVDTNDFGDLAFVADVTAAVTTLNAALAGKQPSLGFVPLNVAQNLADVASAPTARANLGLGPLATQVGASTTAAVVSALGYTPVRQGGGANQGVNVIQLGWDSINATHLRLQVDTNDVGDLAFVADVTAAVATLNASLAGKQANLGFTPVQQSGGAGQLNNKIYLGWDASHLRLQVDANDFGDLAFVADVTAAVATLNASLVGKQASLGFTPVQQSGGAGQLNNKLYLGWDGAHLRLQVDTNDFGEVVLRSGLDLATIPSSVSSLGGASGYMRLSWLLLQWGSVTMPTNGSGYTTSAPVTFPTSFPNACIAVLPRASTPATSTGGNPVLISQSETPSGCTIQFDTNEGTGQSSPHINNSVPVKYFALGY